MKLKSLVSSIAVCGLIASAATAIAAGNPAEERQSMMKNVGAATGAGAKMAKGEVEFNAVAAQLVLRTMNTAALGFGHMFPDGSQTGAETEASPKIWEDRAGFEAAINKFIAATSNDVATSVTDLDSFRAAFGPATENCGACHKAWRVKKN